MNIIFMSTRTVTRGEAEITLTNFFVQRSKIFGGLRVLKCNTDLIQIAFELVLFLG